jgi:hypothetical protein
MKIVSIADLALGLCAFPAFADEPVSDAEGASIQTALALWNCAGGEMEKESGDANTYEIDDAECANGEYDFKLDGDFNIIIATRH